jgi:O-antigen/teichoic acid export membrane protein
LLFLLPVISIVLLPLFASLWHQRRIALLRASVQDLYGYVFLLTVPLVASALIYPDFIINLLFGAKYIDAAPILRWLATGSLFLTLNAVTAAVFSSMGTPGRTARVVTMGAVLNVLGNLLLIPKYGGVGAAIATMFSSLLIFLAGMSFIRSQLGVRPPWRRWLGVIFSGCAFALTLLLSRLWLPIENQYLKVLCAVLLAGIAYALTLLATRTLSIPEVQDLFDRIMNSRDAKGA